MHSVSVTLQVLLVHHEWEHVDTANTAHLPHTTTPFKYHSYLSPPPPPQKQQKQVTKKRTYRDGIPKKQPNKVGMIPQYPYGLSSLYIFPTSHTHTHTHTPAISTANRMWQLQHFTMQHTSPPHTTTYPPHAAIHTLDYIHVPLTPHSTPQSTPTMIPTLFHLRMQQHSFTSPTVVRNTFPKTLLYYTKVLLKKTPNHLHHNLTSCRPM